MKEIFKDIPEIIENNFANSQLNVIIFQEKLVQNYLNF